MLIGSILGAIVGAAIGFFWPAESIIQSSQVLPKGMPLVPGQMAVVGHSVIENASSEVDRFRADQRNIWGGLKIEIGKNITRAGDAKDIQKLLEERVAKFR